MIEMLKELLIVGVVTGCVTAWVVILMRKWGVLEWLQVHGGKLVSKMAGCDYCLNWWLAWAVTVVVVAVTGEWVLVVVPFVSTVIGRGLSA